MRRSKDWLDYLQTLTEQSRELAQHANLDAYASQWAHDLRCVRQGIEHRRVGGAVHAPAQDAWLQAGYTVRQPLLRR